MDKYVIAPPSGSTNNSVGASDRPWKEAHFNSVKLNGGDLGEYLAESIGFGIVSGCEPTISGLTVTVGAGVVHLADGTRKEISASSITLDAADTTNPRIDLVYIDSTGEVAKVTGTAAATPSAPALPANGISVATVSVAANATTGTVTDKRGMLARFYNTGIVNVKDFGAVGDGTTDDTAAIQAAIDYANNVKLPVYIPRTTNGYNLITRLVIYSGTVINSDNAELIFTGGVETEYPFAGYGVITNIRNTRIENVTIRNLTIRVNRHAQHGIYIYSSSGVEFVTFENVTVYNPTWDGILVHGADGPSGSGGDTKPYNNHDCMNWHYRVINCKAINEYLEEKTRTGLMIEQCHNALVFGFYATGFHTGIHVEGASDSTIIGCTCEDNNGDVQDLDEDYHGDYILARSENLNVIGCTARRINKSANLSNNRKYRTLYVTNYFMSGLNISNCSFSKGIADIYAGSDDLSDENKKRGFKFVNCSFMENQLSVAIQSNLLCMGVTVAECLFKRSSIYMGNTYDITIANNYFVDYSGGNYCIKLSSCKRASITNNMLTGGNNVATSKWQRSQIQLDNVAGVAISGNHFYSDATKKGDLAIGIYNADCLLITNNDFETADTVAIYADNGKGAKNSVVTGNVARKSSAGTIALTNSYSFSDTSNIKSDNIEITVS